MTCGSPSSSEKRKRSFGKSFYTFGFNSGAYTHEAVLMDKCHQKGPPDTSPNKTEPVNIKNVENGSEEPKYTRFERLKKHHRRYWYWYLLGGVILLAISLPILFLVVIPAIAQLVVKKAHLPIYSAMLLNPHPSSLTVSLETGIKMPAGISASIDPTTIYMFNRNSTSFSPYFALPFPETHIKGDTRISIVNQTVSILDEKELEVFLSSALYQKQCTASVKVDMVAHMGALKVKITLDKDVEMDGLNSLSGFSILSPTLVPRESNGSNFKAQVSMPNYSVVTLDLGNITVNLQAGGVHLGSGVLNDVLLQPGNNTIDMEGSLNILDALQNISSILQAEGSTMENGFLTVSASANSTIYDSERIDYYENIMRNLDLVTDVSIIEVLGNTLGGILGNDSSLDGILNGTHGAFKKLISDSRSLLKKLSNL